MVSRQRGRAGPSDVTHLTSHLSNRSSTRFGHFLSPERMDCWGFVHSGFTSCMGHDPVVLAAITNFQSLLGLKRLALDSIPREVPAQGSTRTPRWQPGANLYTIYRGGVF